MKGPLKRADGRSKPAKPRSVLCVFPHHGLVTNVYISAAGDNGSFAISLFFSGQLWLWLSLLVEAAIPHVYATQQFHTPMWRLHKGTAAWLRSLARQNGIRPIQQLTEYDVVDCFLNMPRNLVLQAPHYWLNIIRKRGALCFAISKDNKEADYLAEPPRRTIIHLQSPSWSPLLIGNFGRTTSSSVLLLTAVAFMSFDK